MKNIYFYLQGQWICDMGSLENDQLTAQQSFRHTLHMDFISLKVL